ncbi:MAG: hypothetical protein KatS3mg076_3220 [Candidatus Binatia bacterium]|nr:MAG: hypothetical protein KatS3mg076_3220 [Candidatus Binatia bacterium]
MLIPFGPEIWYADGPPVRWLGFPYPTRMAVVRLSGDKLWVWSPISPTESLAEHVQGLGRVTHLVSPNKLHHLFLRPWHERWPEALLHASPGLPRKRPDLPFGSLLADEPHPGWAGEIDQVVFRGSLVMDEVVFFHRKSRTAIVADLVQKLDPSPYARWQRLLLRLDGVLGEKGSAPREWRALFWNRKLARKALHSVLGWQPERLLLAHGTCVPSGASEALREAFSWLGTEDARETPSVPRENGHFEEGRL